MQSRTYIIGALTLIFMLGGCGGSMDLTGEWRGKMIQPEGPQGEEGYHLTLELSQNDSIVAGTSRIEIPRMEYFALMRLQGKAKNDTLYFTEVEILDQKVRTRWCLKQGALKFDRRTQQLTGSWTAEGCYPGTIEVTRVP